MKKFLIMTMLVIGIFMVGKTIMDSQVTTPQEAAEVCNKEFGYVVNPNESLEPYFKKYNVYTKEELNQLYMQCVMRYVM